MCQGYWQLYSLCCLFWINLLYIRLVINFCWWIFWNENSILWLSLLAQICLINLEYIRHRKKCNALRKVELLLYSNINIECFKQYYLYVRFRALGRAPTYAITICVLLVSVGFFHTVIIVVLYDVSVSDKWMRGKNLGNRLHYCQSIYFLKE